MKFDRNKIIADFFHYQCLPLLQDKGLDYSAGLKTPSMNANFSEAAESLGIDGVDKYVIWSVYFAKHLTALIKWIKTREVASEPLSSRIADMVNYLLILYSMTIEDELAKPQPKVDNTTLEAVTRD